MWYWTHLLYLTCQQIFIVYLLHAKHWGYRHERAWPLMRKNWQTRGLGVYITSACTVHRVQTRSNLVPEIFVLVTTVPIALHEAHAQ